jgi:hypothetical protein
MPITDATKASRILLASALLAIAAIPTGWVLHADRKNLCQFATPPDWKADANTASFVASPDGKSNIVVTGAAGATLEFAKGIMEGQYPPEKVLEDTSSRLWYAYSTSGRSNWYVGVATRAGVCGATLSYKDPAAEPVLKQIANTVGAK